MSLALWLRRSTALALSAVVLLFVSGCGSTSTGTSTETGGPVLASNVVVLPSDGTVQVSQITANSMTLSGKVPAVHAGDIILSPLGSGLLVKVVSATTVSQSTSITVQTTQATIEDAFQSCNWNFNYTLKATDLQSFTPTLAGSTLTANTQSGVTKAFHLHTPSADISGKGTINIGMETDIDFNFNGTLQVQNFAVKQFTLVSATTVTVTPSINAAATAKFDGDITIGTFIAEPIKFVVGDVPFIITPTYELHATADGTLAANVSWSPQLTETFSAGLSYSSSTGWETIANLSPLITQSLTPSGTFTGNLNVTPLNPRASFDIDGAVAATISADLPTFNFTGTVNPQTAGWSGTISDTFSLMAGASSPLFSFNNPSILTGSTQPNVLWQDTGPYAGPTTYIYTGKPFTYEENAADGKQITVTLVMNRPLPPNTTAQAYPLPQVFFAGPFYAISSSISDGLNTVSLESEGGGWVSYVHTNAAGNISEWWLLSPSSGTVPQLWMQTSSVTGYPCYSYTGKAISGVDLSSVPLPGRGFGYNNYCAFTSEPGTWSGPIF